MKKVLFLLMCMMVLFSACDNGSTPNNGGVQVEVPLTTEQEAELQEILNALPNVSVNLSNDSGQTASMRNSIRTMQSIMRSGEVLIGDAAPAVKTKNIYGGLEFIELYAQVLSAVSSSNTLWSSYNVNLNQFEGGKLTFPVSMAEGSTIDCSISEGVLKKSTNSSSYQVKLTAKLEYLYFSTDYEATVSYTYTDTDTIFEAWIDTDISAGQNSATLKSYYTSTYPKTEENSFSIAQGDEFRGLYHYEEARANTIIPFKGTGSGRDNLDSLTLINGEPISSQGQVSPPTGYFENSKTDGLIYSFKSGDETNFEYADIDGNVYADIHDDGSGSPNYIIPLAQLVLAPNKTLTRGVEEYDTAEGPASRDYITADDGTTRWYLTSNYENCIETRVLPIGDLSLRDGVEDSITNAKTKVEQELPNYSDFTAEETTIPEVPTF